MEEEERTPEQSSEDREELWMTLEDALMDENRPCFIEA